MCEANLDIVFALNSHVFGFLYLQAAQEGKDEFKITILAPT